MQCYVAGFQIFSVLQASEPISVKMNENASIWHTKFGSGSTFPSAAGDELEKLIHILVFWI